MLLHRRCTDYGIALFAFVPFSCAECFLRQNDGIVSFGGFFFSLVAYSIWSTHILDINWKKMCFSSPGHFTRRIILLIGLLLVDGKPARSLSETSDHTNGERARFRFPPFRAQRDWRIWPDLLHRFPIGNQFYEHLRVKNRLLRWLSRTQGRCFYGQAIRTHCLLEAFGTAASVFHIRRVSLTIRVCVCVCVW